MVKANQCRPLLIPNQPWEEPEAFGYYGSVLYDQGKFRMGYRADIREESRRLAYAESRDGLNLTGRFLAVSGSSFDVSGGDLNDRFSGRKRSFDFNQIGRLSARSDTASHRSPRSAVFALFSLLWNQIGVGFRHYSLSFSVHLFCSEEPESRNG